MISQFIGKNIIYFTNMKRENQKKNTASYTKTNMGVIKKLKSGSFEDEEFEGSQMEIDESSFRMCEETPKV